MSLGVREARGREKKRAAKALVPVPRPTRIQTAGFAGRGEVVVVEWERSEGRRRARVIESYVWRSGDGVSLEVTESRRVGVGRRYLHRLERVQCACEVGVG